MLDTNDQFPEKPYNSDTLEEWFFEALADSSRDAWWIAPALRAGLLVETSARGCPICQDDDQDV